MTGTTDEKFLGEEKEWLVLYAKDKLKEEYFDYFIFGHRHLPIDFQLNEGSRYINLGDWIKYNSYAEFDGTTVQLKRYQ
jgi:UDP-2,3-diacylglucosamine hydrolase